MDEYNINFLRGLEADNSILFVCTTVYKMSITQSMNAKKIVSLITDVIFFVCTFEKNWLTSNYLVLKICKSQKFMTVRITNIF